MHVKSAALAQLVEHLIRNEEVAGSIPAGGSTELIYMSKEAIKTLLKETLSDRQYMALVGLVGGVGILYCLVTALNIHPSDVMVYVRYTAFGEAHFYKDHWQYLIMFVVYGFIVTTVHIVLMLKLRDLGRRQTGIFIGWVGVAILLISFAYTLAVIGLGHAA